MTPWGSTHYCERAFHRSVFAGWSPTSHWIKWHYVAYLVYRSPVNACEYIVNLNEVAVSSVCYHRLAGPWSSSMAFFL